MDLFKERLTQAFFVAMFVFVVLLFVLAGTAVLGVFMWMLSLVNENAPAFVLILIIAGIVLHQGGLLTKWLFVEPIILGLQKRKKK